MNTGKFFFIWGVSSVIFLTMLLAVVCGWNVGFDRWLFHTEFGAFIGCLCCAVLVFCGLRDLFRFIVRILLKLL